MSASQRHQQRHMVSIQRPQRTEDFLPQLSITGLLKRLSIEAACRRSQRWCDVFARAAGGVISDNSREMRPK